MALELHDEWYLQNTDGLVTDILNAVGLRLLRQSFGRTVADRSPLASHPKVVLEMNLLPLIKKNLVVTS